MPFNWPIDVGKGMMHGTLPTQMALFCPMLEHENDETQAIVRWNSTGIAPGVSCFYAVRVLARFYSNAQARETTIYSKYHQV